MDVVVQLILIKKIIENLWLSVAWLAEGLQWKRFYTSVVMIR
jgi:hypothetical protein